MKTNLHGIIKINEIERSFDFKDNKIFIHPNKDEDNFFENFFKLSNEKKHFEFLVARTYDNYLIYFIDITVFKEINHYFAYPKSYTIINHNGINWDFNIYDFSKMILKSNAINSLQNNEYSEQIKRSFIKKENRLENITKHFTIIQGKCELVTSHIINLQDNILPIEIFTELNICFNKKMPIYDIYILIKKINEVFKFIFNRSEITFSSILLETEPISIYDDFDSENKTCIFQATMYFINQLNEFKERNFSKVAIPILNNFNSLLEVVNKEIISYYPKNDKDFHYVDVEKFIKVCGTFEREFDDCFPKFLINDQSDYHMVKTKLLEFLKTLDSKYKNNNGEARKKIKSFEYTINNMNEKLEKRLKFAYNEFEYCLNPRFKQYCKNNKLNNVSINEIFTNFANKRNQFVHTFKSLGFDIKEIAGFVITRELIYCMILKQAKFTNEEINQLINLYQ